MSTDTQNVQLNNTSIPTSSGTTHDSESTSKTSTPPRKELITIRLTIDQYERLCKLVERDEKNREKTREKNRLKRGSDATSRESIVKPFRYEIID